MPSPNESPTLSDGRGTSPRTRDVRNDRLRHRDVLYLKVLGDTRAEHATLILLANSDGLRWPTRLDEAAIERSPFAVAFLDAFAPRR